MVISILLFITIALVCSLNWDEHKRCHKCGNKMDEYSTFYRCNRCGAVKILSS